MNRSTQVALLVTTLALAACGGGGGDDPGTQPPPPTASPTPAARDADVNNVQFAESQTAANTAVSTLNAAVAIKVGAFMREMLSGTQPASLQAPTVQAVPDTIDFA